MSVFFVKIGLVAIGAEQDVRHPFWGSAHLLTDGFQINIGAAFDDQFIMNMTVTVEEMKNYLRIDFEDDDALIENFITAAKKQCMDILRTDDEADLDAAQNGKIAVMFTVAYLYEHREEADHHAMDLTLRALLFGSRKEGF